MDSPVPLVSPLPEPLGAGPDAERPAGAWGSEPGNTDPHNYIPLKLKVLRVGVDSLYLSVRGKLYEDWYGRLVILKEIAQSEDLAVRAKAQVKIGDHLFEVKDRGARFYAFILEDNAFKIQLGKGDTVPVAYVQVRAEYLASTTQEAVIADLRFILNTLAQVKDDLVVSRADLCIDFVPPCPMDGWPVRAWITRARLIEPHYYNHRLNGWSFGRGSIMSGRLYNKLLEILQKSHALYWFELWKARGWIVGEDVWRLEGQFEREVLEQLGIRSPASLTEKLQGLWRYFTEDWLRLAIPNENDHNPTRWPTDPFWLAASAVAWALGDQPRLKRFRKQRIPRDERLFPAAFGYLASFMAREGIEDFGEGVGEFLTQMRAFMDIRGRPEDKDCEELLDERRLAKGRLFNTIDNNRLTKKELAALAEAYRRTRDGKDGIL
jgi:hypothetical protein